MWTASTLSHNVLCGKHWHNSGGIKWTYMMSVVLINISPPGQNGHYFQIKFSNAFSWMKSFCILIRISLKCVPKDPINNIPALVQIMAWCQSGDKPLSEPMLAQFTDAYMRHWGRWGSCHMSIKHQGISDNWQFIYLLKTLLRVTIKNHKSSELLALWEMNPLVAGGFPPQRATDTKSISDVVVS